MGLSGFYSSPGFTRRSSYSIHGGILSVTLFLRWNLYLPLTTIFTSSVREPVRIGGPQVPNPQET